MALRPASPDLTDRERRDRLRLYRCENVGPVTHGQLLRHFGSATAALEALPDLARRGGRARLRIVTAAEAEAELADLARLGAVLVCAGEAAYPVALAACEDAPAVLAVKGRTALLAGPCVAVVGARNASANGRRLAQDIAAGLGAAGLVVVSGLARGIDAAAHAGALASGTVAVLAGGIDVVYPPEHARLHAEIAEAGALVAEMPPGTEPHGRLFPRRNRIISGLSLGTVVVEAAVRSGSLITARRALEQGREVFAVPGSPLDPRCNGSNRLIREGATLTENADDVTAVLAPLTGRTAGEPGRPAYGAQDTEKHDETAVDSARGRVLECLSPSPVAVDELVRQCQIGAAVVSVVLLELELAGRLERQQGGRVALIAAGA
ncbi:MAG: DNA-processing protein DprA [Alphaproteobacteria bacterium]